MLQISPHRQKTSFLLEYIILEGGVEFRKEYTSDSEGLKHLLQPKRADMFQQYE
jgi:hypothetical protein